MQFYLKVKLFLNKLEIFLLTIRFIALEYNKFIK